MTGSWSAVTLGELTADTPPICYGVLKPGPHVDGGVPLIRITDLSDGHVADPSNLHRISDDLDAEFKRSRLRGGEVLISIQGTIGRLAICPPELAGANISRTIARIDPDDRVDRRYLYHYLDSQSGRFQTAGSTRASLNIGTLRKLEIPLPPIEEQRRIAAVLDAADALRAKRHEALTKIDTLTQAIFIDMFGDVFDPRQDESETVALGELMSKRRGSVDPRSAPEIVFDLYSIPAYDAGESELVRGAEIGSSKPRVQPGDVLLSRIVPHIRRCWVVREARGHPQVGSGEWIIFRQEGLVPSFLQAALLSDTFHPRYLQTVAGVGGSLLRARPAHVAEIRIGLPPRDQQAEFARRVDAVKRSAAVAADAVARLDTLFASLQQRAFRGEL